MNTKYDIEYGENPVEVIQFLEEKIYEFNSTRIDKHDGDYFTRIIRDGSNSIIAGIAGWTWAGICEITQLWVTESKRKNGMARILLEAAEGEAKSKQCFTIMVRSYSFQAPRFYEKNGYKIEHVLDSFPGGYKYYILTKKILY